ncbi:MAG: protein-L-isoaspartate(D-aspartate) O-methyltransferase [Gemmatimonadota bacterium]
MTADFVRDRRRMVDRLRAEGIHDLAVLQAFDAVPRHQFVPPEIHHRAYDLVPLPIGYGQTISSPVIHAISLELAELRGGERVLEVGTGSGFQTALLAHLAGEVYSIERIARLADRAKEALDRLGVAVHLRTGDGSGGWPEEAPFDAIIVSAAATEVPGALLAQLADGGRLVVPVGDRRQALYRIRRDRDEYVRERITGALFVPLIEQS